MSPSGTCTIVPEARDECTFPRQFSVKARGSCSSRADGSGVKDVSSSRVSTIRPAVLAAATVATGVLSVLVWHAHGPASWERPFIFFLRHHELPLARPLVLLWQPEPFAVATSALVWVALKSGRAQLATAGGAGCVVAMIVTEHVLKPLVGRHDVYGTAPMFPSGHVTAAAAWAMFAWLVVSPRAPLRAGLTVVPVLVGWAVVSEGLHYPTDAVAGLLVGGTVVYAVVAGAAQLTNAGRELAAARAADRSLLRVAR